ncbi:Platinum sensitivity protein [Vermiconidia calcicola]|uniref:Platinum sensitivity protein n=1 Tax=Vermiconidia calcicola TaxID=1690605 RepID=A0ACC3MA21_9PEZI|nr:Platinum sensitivity protein [Vermiconidia calcicola]
MAHAGQAASAAAAAAASADRKRVKVYELKNNDWYDRGTGFCTGQYVNSPNSTQENPDARVLVVSEDDPDRKLLETQITKDDGYQKQQDTLIVWTESNGVDMALSFQEAEGCASIWEFVSEMQGRLAALAPEDGLSDDLLDPVHSIVLPEPKLGRLDEVENTIRGASTTPAGRDALSKFIMHPEQMYILKLAPLVERAEELESTPDLHRLCMVMKHLILLNDTAIIEFVVTDQAIMDDPDFPSHRANHRQWLSDTSKFKEVVQIDDEEIKRKIHWTYRLLYLKDVVLARILDDPTFSVLNSLIFFHQVDIVNHLQSNQRFLKELFDIFAASGEEEAEKKKEAVLFIQNCCAVSKNIHAQSRAQLYQNFIHNGFFNVVTFALRHHDASVRVAGTDILVALIDHDPHLVRNHIFTAIKEKSVPLTDTLIELLLVEVDLGVKSQMADAIKILLDPTTNQAGIEMLNRGGAANADVMAKRGAGGGPGAQGQQNGPQSQTNQFIDSFYESSAKRLFTPLKALLNRPTMSNLSVQETSLYTHLVDVLCFFVRQHSYKSKLFILSENLHSRVAQLLACPQKYMKLMALKWFRTCVGLQDEFHNRQMIQNSLFDPILLIVEETMPRDNLLNSACLELFEYVKREGVKQLIVHLVENYRERLMHITYVNTFQALVMKYDQLTSGYPMANGAEDSSFTTQEGTPQRLVNGRQSFAGLKEMDGDEEAYFNNDDDGEDDEGLPTSVKRAMINGASPVRPLVSYPDDDDGEEGMDILASSPDPSKEKKSSSSSSDDQRTFTDPIDATQGEPMDEDTTSPTGTVENESPRGRNRTPVPVRGSPGNQGSPPEPLATKRRRDEEDDDELGRMMGGGVKRRTSSASLTGRAAQLNMDGAVNSSTSHSEPDEENGGPVHNAQSQSSHAHGHGNSHMLRRKGSLRTKNESAMNDERFAIKPISLSAVKQQAEPEENGGKER